MRGHLYTPFAIRPWGDRIKGVSGDVNTIFALVRLAAPRAPQQSLAVAEIRSTADGRSGAARYAADGRPRRRRGIRHGAWPGAQVTLSAKGTVWEGKPYYSCRRATIGLSLAARRAGVLSGDGGFEPAEIAA